MSFLSKFRQHGSCSSLLGTRLSTTSSSIRYYSHLSRRYPLLEPTSHVQKFTFTSNALSARSTDLGIKSAWLQIRQESGRARPPLSRSHGYGRGRGSKRNPFDFLDQIPESFVFWGIIGLNGAVFIMWQLAQKRYEIERDPGSYIWMQKNFTSSWSNFASGRIWTAATAMFSHQGFQHILFNMFTFYFLARPVLSILGPRRFLSLYIGGGLVSSFGSMYWHNRIKHRDTSSLGASGAVFAVNSFLACVAPKMIFQIYGIIPVPAWLFVSGVFVFDTVSAMSDKRRETDTAGHVAGILAGIAYYLLQRFGL
ncbi:hypothetical protein J3R30DRAFT_3524204 [Lentinula aciculospora]|uniref:Peptidase S54 rhomboid domain-containing protein n=1 Tax=Lentinula aciculospora TaxID=153920 RepID=A0A9W9A1E3_9AGAR|nr:hypothetical protein J3R30DRAFT_3524204 [Lentinula aciculospora]